MKEEDAERLVRRIDAFLKRRDDAADDLIRSIKLEGLL
jgi:hypothetical protein